MGEDSTFRTDGRNCALGRQVDIARDEIQPVQRDREDRNRSGLVLRRNDRVGGEQERRAALGDRIVAERKALVVARAGEPRLVIDDIRQLRRRIGAEDVALGTKQGERHERRRPVLPVLQARPAVRFRYRDLRLRLSKRFEQSPRIRQDRLVLRGAEGGQTCDARFDLLRFLLELLNSQEHGDDDAGDARDQENEQHSLAESDARKTEF
jgi:hypothetical protein